MTFYQVTEKIGLWHDDCREAIFWLPDNSVDAVVTDPPYHLTTGKRGGSGEASVNLNSPAGRSRISTGFMGKAWDGGDVANDVALWREVLRVLKPGGHICAFGGSRTYHRMACAIEDAGFEIRDSLMWLYGTGFPKSLDVGNAIDDMVAGEWCDDDEMARGYVSHFAAYHEGWGTALKPAFEPIVFARKPISEGTVAANVLRWRTGALNIDGCRVTSEDDLNGGAYSGEPRDRAETNQLAGGNMRRGIGEFAQPSGRWPANVCHDGSDEVIAAFPNTTSGKPGTRRKPVNDGACYGQESRSPGSPMVGFGDSGSAARFFYSAKASKSDRNGSKHPTVKPIALMQWLARLVTPSGGTILDPFAGSGTTGAACQLEGFHGILCEREDEYVADIRRRFGSD